MTTFLATTLLLTLALFVALIATALVPGRNVEAAMVSGIVMFTVGGWGRLIRWMGMEA